MRSLFQPKPTLLVALLATLCLSAVLHAQTTELSAPWGNPLRDGPVRVLFIAPEPTFLDIVEMSRRLDMKVSTLSIPGPVPAESRRAESAEAEPYAQLLKRKYDVIVVSHRHAYPIPKSVSEDLIRKAEAGTGLVLISFAGDPRPPHASFLSRLTEVHSTGDVTRGVPPEVLNNRATGPGFLRLKEYGPIRAAVFSFGGDPPVTHGLVPEIPVAGPDGDAVYEGYLSLLARCILWTAGVDSGSRIMDVEDIAPVGPEAIEIPPELPPEFIQRSEDMVARIPLRPYVLHFDRPTDDDYELRLQLRYPDRGIRRILTREEHVPKGVNRYRIGVPVGLGDFFVDFWLTTRKGTVDWYTEKVGVEGWPEISNVVFSKDTVQTNDQVRIDLGVRRNFYAPRASSLYVRATDSFGRLVAERQVEVGAEAGRMEVQFPLVDLIAPGLKLEVFAVDNRGGALGSWHLQRAAHAWTSMRVRGAPRERFGFAYHPSAAAEINARRYARELRGMGVNIAVTEELAPRNVVPTQHRLRPSNVDRGAENHASQSTLGPYRIDFSDGPPSIDLARAVPWKACLEGYNGVDIGRAYATVDEPLDFPALQGDGTPADWFTEMSRSVSVIRSGFATLLAGATRVESPPEYLATLRVPEKQGDFDGTRMDFAFSRAHILAVTADPWHGARQKVELRFDRAFYVYDMRNGKPLDRRRKETLKLAPGDTRLFSSLPYSVTRVALDVPLDVRRGRRLPIKIEIKTGDSLPGDHIVHINLSPIDATPLPYYSHDVLCKNGRGETYIPLALNDVAGVYTLSARDVLTGTVKTATVNVRH